MKLIGLDEDTSSGSRRTSTTLNASAQDMLWMHRSGGWYAVPPLKVEHKTRAHPLAQDGTLGLRPVRSSRLDTAQGRLTLVAYA